MLSFNDFLEIIQLDKSKIENINCNIKSIELVEDTMDLFFQIEVLGELSQSSKSLIQDFTKVRFKDFSIRFDFVHIIKSSVNEKIREIILEYNPSASALYHSLNIEVMEKNITIYTDNEIFYKTISGNGLRDKMLIELKDYEISDIEFKLMETELTTVDEKDEYIQNIVDEEEKIQSQTVVEKTVQVEEPREVSSYGKKKILPLKKLSDLDIKTYTGPVTVEGSIFAVICDKTRDGNYWVSFKITDYSTSITAKLFLRSDPSVLLENFKAGDNVLITGDFVYSSYDRCEIILVKYIEQSPKEEKLDEASNKRVELRLHSKMSSFEGVTDFNEYASMLKKWGHTSVAITDKADVQGYPDAMKIAKKHGLKVIYGLDVNLVDSDEDIVKYFDEDKDYSTFVVFDIETTGFSIRTDRIMEIGAVKIKDGVIVDRFSHLINPQRSIPQVVQNLTGIDNALVSDKPTRNEIMPEFARSIEGSVLVAHNAKFDTSFIRAEMARQNMEFKYPVLDTLLFARALFPDSKRYNLKTISSSLGISLVNAHRAVNDAEATAAVFLEMLKLAKESGKNTFSEINTLKSQIDYGKVISGSATILVKNLEGLKNLYKIVSRSHMEYYSGSAKIPKSLIEEYREGLLIGTGNSQGEIYKSVFDKIPEKEIIEKLKFYDYIEIQPILNNINFIVDEEVRDYEELKSINGDLYNLGKKVNKPVVATGDVFYLKEHEDLVRRILLTSKPGIPVRNSNIPQKLFLRTTEEMLDEFSYLGEKIANEVVVENTQYIDSQIEKIDPIPSGTYPPVIEGAEEDLKSITLNRVHEIYGENPDKIVMDRLEKELNSIIKNGYAVLYIIAQKLVKKSNEDGYIVGSRGSVGSSFVATMCGITEVNPLPPHYICENCKHTEFISDISIGSGVDLEDKVCPKCGTPLKKEGHNIPFEVFLGFDGDKEPDIDLNFASEYQSRAHKYTEELFGKGYVFRAGTVTTIAERTAYGYVKKYFEGKGSVNPAEIDRLVLACQGVKRSSGQHPGGIMIVPKSKEIFDFTPIQYPADDKSSGVITTHFAYEAISGKILKLDNLGHDGPTMIKMLEDITGVDSSSIPLDDKKTMSLFSSSQELNLDENIFKSETGSLGIPEFGTSFVIKMLLETNPSTFSDLVRISGLSHGTDVWTGNAQELVNNGFATLSDVICTREDIMIYLINAGAENKMAFDVMEKVRKGKGLTEEQIAIMNELPLPNWYIDSCQKIKYMFPKAHAVAYVMLSFRIAYFKLYYPEAYYSVYFSIKLADFDGSLIREGIHSINRRVDELNNLKKEFRELSQKDKNELTVLEVVLEMLARGIEFESVDIYRSLTNKFKVSGPGKILMPLRALSGIGEGVAENIVKAREDGEYISVEDFIKRTKATKSVVEILRANGCLNMQESNQISLFNM